MKLRQTATKTITVSLLVCLTIFTFLVPLVRPVYATSLEDQLAQIERDLAAIVKSKQDLQANIDSQQNKIGQYSGEVGKLRAQTESLQIDISKLDLQIQEVTINIQILEQQIAEKQTDIKNNEEQASLLEDESASRIKDNYMNYRVHKSGSVDFFTVKSANTYFKDSQYQEIIQDDTNKVLEQLANLKLQLEKDKADLEEKNVNIQRNKAMLDEQHSQLDRAQSDLQSKMNSYNMAIYNAQNNINGTASSINQLSAEEIQKQAQRDQIRQQLFNSYNPITGQYVVAGTVIGYQGATGFAFGEHLHFYLQINGSLQDPCNYFPSSGGPVGSYAGPCGGNGQIQWPYHGNFWYTNSFWAAQNLPGQAPSYHFAVDLAHEVHGAPIYATQSGWICTSVDQYGAIYNVIYCPAEDNGCNGFHGFKTGYWHMSSTLVQNHC